MRKKNDLYALNINKMVSFRLAKVGADILNKFYEEIHNSLHFEQPCPHYEGGQIVEMQLWQIMEIFGSHMSVSSICPIYNCNIFIKKEDLQQTTSIQDYEKEHD